MIATDNHLEIITSRKSAQENAGLISVSWGEGVNDKYPSHPESFATCAAFAEAIQKRAKLDRFDRNVSEAEYSIVKECGPWIVHGVDPFAGMDSDTGKLRRKKRAFTSVNYAMFDIDKAKYKSYDKVRAFLRAQGVSFVMHTTTGNGLKIKGDADGECFRVFIPFGDEHGRPDSVPGKAYDKLCEAMREKFFPPSIGALIEPCGDVITQPAFLPPKGARVDHQDAEPFDVMGFIVKHDLTLHDGEQERQKGSAEWGVFEPLADLLLGVPDASEETDDGELSIVMPGQGDERRYSTDNNPDKWQFTSPSGGNEWIRFRSLHMNSEPKETFKIRDALALIPGALDVYDACLLEIRTPGQAERVERINARREAVLNGELSEADNEDAFEWLPQTREIGAELCKVCAGIGIPMEAIFANAQPFPEGLLQFGVNLDAIDTFFRSACWSPDKGRAYVMTPIGKMAIYVRQDVARAQQYFKPWFDPKAPALVAVFEQKAEEEKEQAKAIEKARKKAAILGEEPPEEAKPKRGRPKKRNDTINALGEMVAESVIDKLRDVRNQAGMLRHVVDMFADRPNMAIDSDGVATFTRPFTPFPVNTINPVFLERYKAYFPRLDELIEYLAACRFASDRKNAFLWINAPSDWGKGFFTSALSALGVVIDIEAEQLNDVLSGKASGFTAADFVNTWALLVNEAKKITPNMKRLEKELTINPKMQMVARVQVYAKLFTSKEQIGALAGEHGVEEQFANRFNLWQEHGDLKKVRDFLDNRDEYFETVSSYIAERLNELVESYRMIGPREASRHADGVLTTFHKAHGIANHFGKLEDSFDDLRAEFVAWCLDMAAQQRHDFAQFVLHDGERRFLTNVPKVFETWARVAKTQNEAQFLIDNRAEITGHNKHAKQVWVKGAPRRGIWLSLKGNEQE
ncbi:hypothetical protein CUW27_20800 [Salmonella enterica]|nr:hypothetical protein [Salmonella enterica]